MSNLSIIAGAPRAAPKDQLWAVGRAIRAAFTAFIRFIWRHLFLIVVLAGAVTLRLLMLRAYPYAFFFSDSRPYVAGAYTSVPYPIRPYGYSLLLKPFVPGPLDRVAVAQHLVGLGLIIGGYAFLVRRGTWRWLAALAMVPIALDARQVTLEHYVLAETAYVALTAAALFVLAWRPKVGAVAAAGGGVLLGLAAITRSVGLPVLALVVLYLLVRRIGWARFGAFLLPVALILGGYLIWYHHTYQVYAFGEYQGRFLAARVMPIVDCTKLELTPLQRSLCVPDPPQRWKQRPDQYIWNPASPMKRLYPGTINDPFLNEFAKTVIKQEPGKYAGLILTETGWHLLPKAPLEPYNQCAMDRWLPPALPGELCNAPYYLDTRSPIKAPEPTIKVPNPLGERLHAYGTVMTTPGPLYAAGVLLAVFAAAWRPRRRGWRTAADALLFVGTGFGLIVVSVATSIFDYRYSIPAVLLIPIGIALSVNQIVAVSRPKREAPAAPVRVLTQRIPAPRTKAAAEHVN
jgi:4-amino-4-deoxy-L-arabinose transferase-like glycosyltransferase